MPKGFQPGHQPSANTRKKIGDTLRRSIIFKCDNCGVTAIDKPSSFARKKRHFCGQDCYSEFRKDKLPIHEHSRFGTGHSSDEREKRKKARSILNHHLRDKRIKRPGCAICGEKAEAHHANYDRPLEVEWLCFEHHRESNIKSLRTRRW